MEFPKCPHCKNGVLVPFSSGKAFNEGAYAITYDIWACTNDECKYHIYCRGTKAIYTRGDEET